MSYFELRFYIASVTEYYESVKVCAKGCGLGVFLCFLVWERLPF
jgi:hypothetical protein